MIRKSDVAAQYAVVNISSAARRGCWKTRIPNADLTKPLLRKSSVPLATSGSTHIPCPEEKGLPCCEGHPRPGTVRAAAPSAPFGSSPRRCRGGGARAGGKGSKKIWQRRRRLGRRCAPPPTRLRGRVAHRQAPCVAGLHRQRVRPPQRHGHVRPQPQGQARQAGPRRRLRQPQRGGGAHTPVLLPPHGGRDVPRWAAGGRRERRCTASDAPPRGTPRQQTQRVWILYTHVAKEVGHATRVGPGAGSVGLSMRVQKSCTQSMGTKAAKKGKRMRG